MSPKRSSKSCVIIGGGGHAKVVIDALVAQKKATPTAVLDSKRALWGKKLAGVTVQGGDDKLPELYKKGVRLFVLGVGAAGNNMPREKIFESCVRGGFKPCSVVHPSAVVARSADVGEGSVVFARAVINASAAVGRNVIVNTGAIVEHDCVIGDHAHISTGARLGGGVRVGRLAHVGIGAVIRQGVTIGERAVVGAGAVVVKNVSPGAVVAGVPARPIK